MPKITFYFLYLLEPTEEYREKYSELSKNVLKGTGHIRKLFDLQDQEINNPEENNPEKWCKLDTYICDYKTEVKYYKERIILTIHTEFDTECLNELFKHAKNKRENFLENDLVRLDSLQEKICSQCEGCIRSVYLYPLIEIDKDYERTDFDLNDEAITTFFYEIPDVGNTEKIFFFSYKYKNVLVRVSGPSIITTKLSPIMKAKLINLIYESALYKMRETERKNGYEPCKKISGENFEYLRNYIAQIFFSVESGASQIGMTSNFQLLSYISALGVLAGIFAITYAIFYIPPPFPPIEHLKTIAATILFILTIIMLWRATKIYK